MARNKHLLAAWTAAAALAFTSCGKAPAPPEPATPARDRGGLLDGETMCYPFQQGRKFFPVSGR